MTITDSRAPYSPCSLILVIQYCTSCRSPAFELSTALIYMARTTTTMPMCQHVLQPHARLNLSTVVMSLQINWKHTQSQHYACNRDAVSRLACETVCLSHDKPLVAATWSCMVNHINSTTSWFFSQHRPCQYVPQSPVNVCTHILCF